MAPRGTRAALEETAAARAVTYRRLAGMAVGSTTTLEREGCKAEWPAASASGRALGRRSPEHAVCKTLRDHYPLP